MENKDTLIVHQAYFGNVHNSHGCIASSINNEQLQSELLGFTDRPSKMPAGVELHPYIAAASFCGYFVVTKTFPDLDATRAGMVFTHALIVALEDVLYLNEFELLTENFVDDKIEKPALLHPITLKVRKLQKNLTEEQPKPYVQTMAEALTTGKVIFEGELLPFIEGYSTLWDRIAPQLRRFMSIGVGFSESDTAGNRSLFLFFQERKDHRLSNDSKITSSSVPTSAISHDPVQRFILGDTSTNLFALFLDSLAVKLGDFQQFSIAQKAFTLYQHAEEADSNQLRQLIRLVAKLSPSPTIGTAIKDKLIDRLNFLISNGEDYQLKALRNIDLVPFRGGTETLAEGIEKSIIGQITGKFSFDTATLNELITLSAVSENNTWWSAAIFHALKKAFLDPKSTGNIWRLLISPDADLGNISVIIPAGPENEVQLLSAFPKYITKEKSNSLKQLCRGLRYFKIYAKLSLLYLSHETALKEQLTLEEEEKAVDFTSSKLISEVMTDDELLMFNLSERNEQALTWLIDRMVKTPQLLRNLDPNSDPWLSIWDAYITRTNLFDQPVLNMQLITAQLIDRVCEGQHIPSGILNRLSVSKYADLSSITGRSRFWKNIDPGLKPAFINATAAGFASKLAMGNNVTEEPEQEIKQVLISNSFITHFLNAHRDAMQSVLNYYEAIVQASDEYLAGFVRNYQKDITALESASLGALSLKRGYSATAKAIFDKAKYNSTFKIALEKSKSLLHLGIFDRILYGKLFGETLNDDAAFTGLLELLKNIYPKGPEDNDIWERAGGDIGKLSNSRTREENWRHAVHLARHGGGGKDVSIKSLLKIAHEDFSDNAVLNELRKYFKNQ